MKFGTLCFAVTALGAAVIVSPLSAHMVLQQGEAAAGSYYKATFGAGHGCEGSPTIRVRIQIPDGVTSVKPQPKAGWQLSTVKKTYKTPIVDHGRTITEGVGEVIWTGGKLLDENYDEFVIQVKLPETAGATVYFPAVQECEVGVHRWIEIPEAGKTRRDYKEPAPQVVLVGPGPRH
jgi:periplasmic copper chaperone A